MPTEPHASPLPAGEFVGREQLRQHLRDALALAASQGWPELTLFDADFRDWPLGERAVVDSLNAWALGRGRQLTLLALRYDGVPRQHPLFVRWRQQWSHKVEARVCRPSDVGESLHSALYCALPAPAWGLLCHDGHRFGGRCGTDAGFLQRLHEQLQQLQTRSRPGFAAYTLGL